ncbi:MAG: Hpt domain-containing protein [Magnetococcus sp. YQC-5]
MFDAEAQQAFMQEFLSENREAMDRVERGLLLLESGPTNHEWLNSVFRDMHTVKGNCRMMEWRKRYSTNCPTSALGKPQHARVPQLCHRRPVGQTRHPLQAGAGDYSLTGFFKNSS